MSWANFIYYAIYRFVIKTPARSYADAWPIAFLALTMWIHGLSAYFIIARLVGSNLIPSAQLKGIGIAVMTFLTVLFFFHYVVRGNGSRVITSFEKQGSDRKYAQAGAIMFVETLLLPLALVCILILKSKLNGSDQ